jgi:hypothetical protein
VSFFWTQANGFENKMKRVKTIQTDFVRLPPNCARISNGELIYFALDALLNITKEDASDGPTVDNTTARKIELILNELLPRTSSYLSNALSVVPVTGDNLRISTSELTQL